MRRREFITPFGGAVGWLAISRAQQPAMPMIGYLPLISEADWVNYSPTVSA
jgi:hypothetical protein